MSEETKHCKRCNLTKTVDQFGVDRSQRDGKNRLCSECTRELSRERYANDPKYRERMMAKSKEWRSFPENREKALAATKAWNRERYANDEEYRERELARAKARNRSDEGREYHRTYMRERRKSPWSQAQQQSHNAVKSAIRLGLLPPAKDCTCDQCGQPATDYHHKSYAKKHQLLVIPLCKTCHSRLHAELKKEKSQCQP